MNHSISFVLFEDDVINNISKKKVFVLFFGQRFVEQIYKIRNILSCARKVLPSSIYYYIYYYVKHLFSKPDMKTWLVVPEGQKIIHPVDYKLCSSFFLQKKINSMPITRSAQTCHERGLLLGLLCCSTLLSVLLLSQRQVRCKSKSKK